MQHIKLRFFKNYTVLQYNVIVEIMRLWYYFTEEYNYVTERLRYYFTEEYNYVTYDIEEYNYRTYKIRIMFA